MISLFDNDMSKIAAGRARLELRDVAEVQTFDMRLDETAVFTNVTPGADTTITRAPGSFSLDAVATGQSSSLIGATSLVLREGQTTVVYVVGSSAAHTLDFMVQDVTNLATSPADVATGSGGLAARSGGVPAWVIATMICAALGVAGSVRALRA